MEAAKTDPIPVESPSLQQADVHRPCWRSPLPISRVQQAPMIPFYDPALSYEANYQRGPFGRFAEMAGASEVSGHAPSKAEGPTHTLLGQPVDLPFGIAAGPLVNSRYIAAALGHGFDLPVYKTVRSRSWACHPWPNVLAVDVEGDLHPTEGRLQGHTRYAEPYSVTNSFGVPSFEPDVWQPDLARAVAAAGPGQVVIGSFQGTPSESGGVDAYIADFAAAARLVRETGAKMLEVNLSCPNEGTAHLLCFDTDRARAVVEAIKNELGDLPLIAKIAYFHDEAALRRLVDGVGRVADAIAAINTIGAEIVNERGEQALPGEGRSRSGVGGGAIRWAGLATVERLARLRDELGLRFRIIGSGGVSEPSHYAAYRMAGADAVMSATAAMWNPLLAQQIRDKTEALAHAG